MNWLKRLSNKLKKPTEWIEIKLPSLKHSKKRVDEEKEEEE
jgi:hypothetical protein